MWVIIFFSLLGVFLTYMQDVGFMKRGMLLGFSLMAILLSVRYGYGNDFFNYLDIFNDCKYYDWDNMLERSKWVEIGWLVLSKAFVPLGFQCLIAFHTVFILGTFYYLINKYVPNGWKWLAVFFVFFNAGILIIYISMMRQAMSICLFLLAVDSALDKKIIKMALFTLLAYYFHHSSIVIIPFVVFAYFQSGWLTSLGLASGLLFMVVVAMNDSVATSLFTYALSSVEMLEEDYEGYLRANSGGSGLGVFLELALFVPSLFDYKKYSKKEKIIMFIFLVNMLVFPLQYVAAMFSRIRYYFVVFGFLYLPFALKTCQYKALRYSVLGLTLFITLWNYYQFFTDRTFARAYSVFQTFF